MVFVLETDMVKMFEKLSKIQNGGVLHVSDKGYFRLAVQSLYLSKKDWLGATEVSFVAIKSEVGYLTPFFENIGSFVI